MGQANRPATGYNLQSGSSLSTFNDMTPTFQAQFGTVFGALVPKVSSGNVFYRLIKRVPYQLQVLMPGQTNAPNTALGYTGTPTDISVSGEGLTTVTVTVNMCDATWHIVNSSDSVTLSTSDSGDYLPATQPVGMVNGTATFADPNGILFVNQGPRTVTAVDNTTATILQGTSASFNVVPDKWVVPVISELSWKHITGASMKPGPPVLIRHKTGGMWVVFATKLKTKPD